VQVIGFLGDNLEYILPITFGVAGAIAWYNKQLIISNAFSKLTKPSFKISHCFSP
jgi:hypothetical protein